MYRIDIFVTVVIFKEVAQHSYQVISYISIFQPRFNFFFFNFFKLQYFSGQHHFHSKLFRKMSKLIDLRFKIFILKRTNLLTALQFFADHWNKPELLWSNHYKFLEVFVYVFSSGHLYTCSILQLQELCNQDLKIVNK